MRIDRRQFNALAFSAMASSVSAGSIGGVFASEANIPFSIKTLNRLTFGANIASRAEFEALGKKAWLQQQLSMPVLDLELEQRLANARLRLEYEAGDDGEGKSWPARNENLPYMYLETEGAELLPLTDFETNSIAWEERIRPAREVQVSSFIRATHTKAQLREVMTQFWHDHFNVDCQRGEVTAAYFARYDEIMRRNALGNFRQMLGEMTKSAAMLFYLNNEASQASPANENFARELLELHTLGAPNYVNGQYNNWAEVPGAREGLALGYLDEDVYEVARAFTGWTFGDGRYLEEGSMAPKSGTFYYADSWHDPYQKRIMGVEFGPNSGPLEDGERVLDILAKHPGTARFVCEKICRRLLMDQPPVELIEAAAEIFLARSDAPDQISHVIRFIVMSDVFDATPARKLKRPYEFVISLFRATGADIVSPTFDMVYFLARTGWTQHAFRPPTGHSDFSGDWANTSALNGMVDAALYALSPDLFGSEPDFREMMGPDVSTWGEAATFWFERFGGVENPHEVARTLLSDVEIDPAIPLSDDPEEVAWGVGTIIGLAALTPGFLFR